MRFQNFSFPQEGRTIYSTNSALKLYLFYGSCRTDGNRSSPLFTGIQETIINICAKLEHTYTHHIAREDLEMYRSNPHETF